MTGWENLSDEDIKIIVGKVKRTDSVLENIKKELLEKTRHIVNNENTESFNEDILQAILVINKYIDEVKKQPAAKWEWVQYESFPDFGNYHCSKCRFIVHRINGYNYCPQCGTRMESDKEK